MPSETLQLHYPAIPRVNRRRPKPRTLAQTITRLVLLLVGLVILIAILIKLGVIQENPRPISIAAKSAFPPSAFPHQPSTFDARRSTQRHPNSPVLAFSFSPSAFP